MTDLYKNKYKISSARLQTWDYGDAGMYFVTICTADRKCLFGNIGETQRIVETQCIASLQSEYSDTIMQLNDLGKRVETEWLRTADLRPDMNIEIKEYVVMPNHFHGIIYIGENSYNDRRHRCCRRDAMHCVSTTTMATENSKNKFGPQSKNLASIIRGFKSAVTTYARKNDILFNWQTRFHDHIITSNDEYQRIADYIMDNPAKWQSDRFYK